MVLPTEHQFLVTTGDFCRTRHSLPNSRNSCLHGAFAIRLNNVLNITKPVLLTLEADSYDAVPPLPLYMIKSQKLRYTPLNLHCKKIESVQN